MGGDVWLSVSARGLSFLGDEVATIALVLRAQHHGAGTVAALFAANLAPIALLTGPVGRVADRFGTRRLLVTASAVQLGACVGLAFLSALPMVLALVAVLGAGQAVTSSTWQALLPGLVRRDDLPAAIGLGQAAVTAAGIAAPAIGGLLAGRYGVRVPLLIDAASFAAVGGAAMLLRRPRPAPAGVAAAAVRGRGRGGLAIVRRDPLLRAAIAVLGLFVLLGSMVNVVDVFLVRSVLHASATWYGASAACYMTGVMLGVLASRRLPDYVSQARGIVWSAALLGGGLVAMGLAPSMAWLLAFSVVTGACNGVFSVCNSALIMGAADPAERGRVAAVVGGVVAGMQLGAYAVSGALATVLSPRAVFVLGGLAGASAPLALGAALVRTARRRAVAGLPADAASVPTSACRPDSASAEAA
jgi:MFS family permease